MNCWIKVVFLSVLLTGCLPYGETLNVTPVSEFCAKVDKLVVGKFKLSRGEISGLTRQTKEDIVALKREYKKCP